MFVMSSAMGFRNGTLFGGLPRLPIEKWVGETKILTDVILYKPVNKKQSPFLGI